MDQNSDRNWYVFYCLILSRIYCYGLTTIFSTVEWGSPLYDYVDPYAVQLRNGSVKESMGYWPRPPPCKPEKQGPGQDISDALGEKQIHDDRARQARTDFRYDIYEHILFMS